MRRLLSIVLVLALLWCGYWVAGAIALDRGMSRWLEDREAEGWVAEAGTISVRGFPTDFRLGFADLDLADPDTGVALSTPELSVAARAWQPMRATVTFPPLFTVASPLERIAVGSEAFSAHLGLQGRALAVDAAEIDLAAVTLQSTLGRTAGLARGALSLSRPGGDGATYDVVFEADDLTPFEARLRQLDPAGVLPPQIAALRLTGQFAFDRPWDRRAIEEARPQPRSLDIALVQATWGDLELKATGKLDIDAEGVPTGAVVVKATNWREMLVIAENAGAFPPGLRDPIERGLEMLSRLSGNTNDLDATISFRDGIMTMGPIPLGPAPRFVLR